MSGFAMGKGDSAPLKTPGLLTDDGLREMMKALAVAWVLHDAAAQAERSPFKASTRRAKLLTINIKFAPWRR